MYLLLDLETIFLKQSLTWKLFFDCRCTVEGTKSKKGGHLRVTPLSWHILNILIKMQVLPSPIHPECPR